MKAAGRPTCERSIFLPHQKKVTTFFPLTVECDISREEKERIANSHLKAFVLESRDAHVFTGAACADVDPEGRVGDVLVVELDRSQILARLRDAVGNATGAVFAILKVDLRL